MSQSQQPDFIELIVSKGIIDEQTAKELSANYQGHHYSVLLHLVNNNIAPRKQLGRVWGDLLGIAYTDLKKTMFQQEILEKLPEEFARQNRVILIYQLSRAITAATDNPKNEILLNKIEQITKTQISPVFSFPDEIEEAINENYPKKETTTSTNKIENELPSVIPEKTKEYLVYNTKYILNEVSKGSLPDLSVCNDVRNTIVNEVNEKFTLVQCINQLRIVDEYTYSHSVNVAMLSSAIGKVLGYSINVIKELALGALLHDIGKIHPNHNNKNHPILGYQLLKSRGIPERIAEIVYNHHERIDGKGYPRGIARDDISVFAQIVSIVDIYDNLVTDRPGYNKISYHEALNVMLMEGQSSFNFELLYKFVNLVYKQDLNSVKKTFKSILYGEPV